MTIDLDHLYDGDPKWPQALAEREFAQELLREGVLDQVPSVSPEPCPFQHFNPVAVAGKPVSLTIIEERR
jgi:hypothetical protein